MPLVPLLLRAHFNTDVNGQAAHPGTITYTFVSTGKEQTDETALKFMGIPIDGSEQDMVAALKAKGFESHYSGAYLTGVFNGENVRVIKSDQIDKFQLASKCNNWLLNEPLCHQVKSYYQDNYIFIWEHSYS